MRKIVISVSSWYRSAKRLSAGQRRLCSLECSVRDEDRRALVVESKTGRQRLHRSRRGRIESDDL
jgi:hypothetical protein